MLDAVTQLLPLLAYKIEVIKAKSDKVTTSPIAAAMGVAKLSGLSLYRTDNKIIPTNSKSDKEKEC